MLQQHQVQINQLEAENQVLKERCASYEQENQRLTQANQHLKRENRDYNQQIGSLNEENQRVKQENYDFGQQIESLKKEKQRLIQNNRQLEQEIQKCKQKIDDLEETIQSIIEPIEHQNLRTTAPSGRPRISIGASAMTTSKCKFESKNILKNVSQQLIFVLRKIKFKSCF